jgi:hypothetical protein
MTVAIRGMTVAIRGMTVAIRTHTAIGKMTSSESVKDSGWSANGSNKDGIGIAFTTTAIPTGIDLSTTGITTTPVAGTTNAGEGPGEYDRSDSCGP